MQLQSKITNSLEIVAIYAHLPFLNQSIMIKLALLVTFCCGVTVHTQGKNSRNIEKCTLNFHTHVTDPEFRGVWVASVTNIDWPRTRTGTTAENLRDLVDLMDESYRLNMNTIILQVTSLVNPARPNVLCRSYPTVMHCSTRQTCRGVSISRIPREQHLLRLGIRYKKPLHWRMLEAWSSMHGSTHTGKLHLIQTQHNAYAM